MIVTVKLDSTCLSEATYDDVQHDMTLEFARGGRYKYFDVPESVYRGIVDAPSPGRAFHATVRDNYNCARI